jgi:hypothetical protein
MNVYTSLHGVKSVELSPVDNIGRCPYRQIIVKCDNGDGRGMVEIKLFAASPDTDLTIIEKG